MTRLLERHSDPLCDFQFGIHPFYDWSRSTIETFGTWQDGPYNRWSPCGGDRSILEIFGAGLDATPLAKEKGIDLLEGVLEILLLHLQWVDSLAEQPYTDITQDLPLVVVQQHMEEIQKKVIFDYLYETFCGNVTRKSGGQTMMINSWFHFVENALYQKGTVRQS